MCTAQTLFKYIYRSGWGACLSRIMSSVQIYGTTLAPGTIIQTLISCILYSRDICTVIFTLELPINEASSYLFFTVRFVGVRWGSYLILVYPFKCVANSTSLNNNSVSVCQKLLTLPTSLSKWVNSAQGYGSLDLFYLYVL